MKRKQNIGDALFPRIKRMLLTLFLVSPQKKYYFREITRILNASTGAVQGELRRLERAEIIRAETAGRQRYYWANTDCMIFPQLRDIVVRTFGVADTIKTALAPLSSRIDIVFIYGSIADRTDTGESDIDLLVAGKISLKGLIASLQEAQQTLNRQINPTLYSRSELSEKIRSKNHFITSIINSEKIFIIGDADDLAAMG